MYYIKNKKSLVYTKRLQTHFCHPPLLRAAEINLYASSLLHAFDSNMDFKSKATTGSVLGHK